MIPRITRGVEIVKYDYGEVFNLRFRFPYAQFIAKGMYLQWLGGKRFDLSGYKFEITYEPQEIKGFLVSAGSLCPDFVTVEISKKKKEKCSIH
jgi:hypothetical protein